MVPHTISLYFKQSGLDWVLRIFGTQVIKKKRPIRPVFPNLSISYDYAEIQVSVIGNKQRDSNSIYEFY